jgi:hypothetical protein
MLFIVSDRSTQLYPAKDKGQSSIGVFDYLRLWAAESALQMRSVCWITTGGDAVWVSEVAIRLSVPQVVESGCQLPNGFKRFVILKSNGGSG